MYSTPKALELTKKDMALNGLKSDYQLVCFFQLNFIIFLTYYRLKNAGRHDVIFPPPFPFFFDWPHQRCTGKYNRGYTTW